MEIKEEELSVLNLLRGQTRPHLAAAVLSHLDITYAVNASEAVKGAFKGCGAKARVDLTARHNLSRHHAKDLVQV